MKFIILSIGLLVYGASLSQTIPKDTLLFAQDNDSEEYLCQVFEEMLVNDQKYRGAQLKGGTLPEVYQKILDSLLHIGFRGTEINSGLNRSIPDSLKQRAYDLLKKEIKPRYVLETNDSIRQLQEQLDISNTERLIQIVDAIGWPEQDMFECRKIVFKIGIIFRHSPVAYRDKIRVLIEREKTLNRIPEHDYLNIDDHIRGRPSRFKQQ